MSIRTELRLMTDEEKAAAEALHVSAVPVILGEGVVVAATFAFMGAAVGVVVDVIVSEVFRIPFGSWMNRGIGTVALLGFVYALWTIWRGYRNHRERTLQLRDDIAGAVVEVLDVEAFIAWEEIDSVPAFLFDVAEASPLSVRGEPLAEAVAAGKFPCRRFGLVRLPATRKVLSVQPRGEYFPPRA